MCKNMDQTPCNSQQDSPKWEKRMFFEDEYKTLLSVGNDQKKQKSLCRVVKILNEESKRAHSRKFCSRFKASPHNGRNYYGTCYEKQEEEPPDRR